MTPKEIIQKVIETGEEHKIEMQPIEGIDKAFEELGFDEYEGTGDELNGWEVDFWYNHKHPVHGMFTLSGSLFYGEWKIRKT